MSRQGEVGVFGAGELTLSGDVVLMFAAWMKDYRNGLRNGGRTDPDVERWATAVLLGAERTLSARTSGNGTSELPIEAKPRSPRILDPVGSEGAAKILGCSPRWFTALCKAGVFTAEMKSGRWFAERSEVELHTGGTADAR